MKKITTQIICLDEKGIKRFELSFCFSYFHSGLSSGSSQLGCDTV
jgi:hypothetical protein